MQLYTHTHTHTHTHTGNQIKEQIIINKEETNNINVGGHRVSSLQMNRTQQNTNIKKQNTNLNAKSTINNERIDNIYVGADASVRPLKGNNQKGITLLALIITIIVLLILSVVSIKLLTNSGIMSHSKRAVKQYQEAEFEEKINLIFSSYVMKNYAGGKINNKEITNKVLNIFNYPNINEETGELKNAEEGTTDTYLVTATNGNVTVKSSKNKEINLQVDYDINDKPDFQIIYNGKIYKYKNYKLESKTDYYIEAQDETEWVYKELEDGTLKVTNYKGKGITNKETNLVDLVVPNKINNKVVSTACFVVSITQITGKLTISPGISLEYYPLKGFYNISELELMENVTNNVYKGGTGLSLTANNTLKKITLNNGVEINNLGLNLNSVLKDIIIQGNVTLTGNVGTNNITNETVNNIVNNANILGCVFNGTKFNNEINLTVTKDTEKFNSAPISGCSNINTLIFEEGTKIGQLVNNCDIKLLEIKNNSILKAYNFVDDRIEEVIIHDNCTANSWQAAFCNGSINKITIGNGFKVQPNNYRTGLFNKVSNLKKIKIGNDCALNSGTHGTVFENMPELKELEIGNNAKIDGRLFQGSYNGATDISITKVTFGEKCEFTSSRGDTLFANTNNLEEVTFGKESNIPKNAFSAIKGDKKLSKIILYLTDEQKRDNTKIPTSWKDGITDSTITVNLDNEKAVWTVTVLNS